MTPPEMLAASTASRGMSSSSSPTPRAAWIKSVCLADFVSQIFIILVLIIRLTEQNRTHVQKKLFHKSIQSQDKQTSCSDDHGDNS